MSDELKRKKYISLKQKLKIIRKDINNLSNDYINLKNNLEKGITIDKKTIGLENLNSINKNNIDIYNELNNTVFPIINKNINQ